MDRNRPAGSRLSRQAFVAGTAGALAASALGPAAAAEQRVNQVLVEGDRWLLPAWETLTDADDAGVASTLDLVAQTAGLLAAKRIALVLLVLPFKARYCDTLAPGEISEAVQTRYARALAGMAARKLPTVDLDAAFRAVRSPQTPIYYRTDQHWTDTGVQAAAPPLAQLIGSMRSATPAAKRPPIPPLVTVERTGDLTALLPPDMRAAIGPQTYHLRTEWDGDAAGYNEATGEIAEGADIPAIQLVGESFVRPMWGLPQTLANALGEPIGTTFFNGDAGPYHALALNLRTSLPRRRPDIIVWQMTEANLHLGPAAQGWWDIADLMSPDFFLAHVRDALATLP